jgi:phospholipid/cholesterol/gamma-HCH transport system substrate-binding protein
VTGRAEKVRVGLFLIACTALVVVVILALAGISTKKVVLYKVRFDESVSGLDEASPVKFEGKKVGKVRSIAIEEGLPIVTIAVAPETHVTESTVAEIDYLSYASGTRYIELRGGTPYEPPLPTDREIPSRPSAFAALSRLGPPATKTFENLSKFVDEDMRRKVEALVGDADRAVREASAALAENQKGLDRDLETLDRALREAREAIEENRPGVKSSIERIDDAAGALRDVVVTASRTAMVERAEETLASVRKAADALARLADGAHLSLERNGGAIDEIFANLRAASRDIAAAARELKERPALLLRDGARPARTGE